MKLRGLIKLEPKFGCQLDPKIGPSLGPKFDPSILTLRWPAPPASLLNSACLLAAIAAGMAALLTFSGCRHSDFPDYPANYREFAYIPNGGSNTVTILDVVHVRIDRELTVGEHPIAVAISPTRNEVYILNSGNDSGNGSVSVLNAGANQVVATIPVRRKPMAIAVDGSGRRAYVANFGSNSISVIDLDADREVAVLGVGDGPAALRLSPDDKTLVVANSRAGSIVVLDLSQTPSSAPHPLRAVFEGCPGANDVVILPDSSKAFAACADGHQVMAILLAHSGQPDRLEALLDVGKAPVHLALKPDGGELFVSNSASDTISEVSTPTNDVSGAYLMGDQPVRGLVSPDNSLLYVSNFGSQEVTLYAIDDGKRTGTIRVGDGPTALALSTAGHLLFVVDSRSADVAVVRTSSRSLFTILSTGKAPNGIAIKAFTVK